MNEQLLAVLQKVRFLEDATPEEQQKIASIAKIETFEPNVIVFREGERLSRIFVVLEGSVGLEVRVSGQGAKRIHTIGPGELLGWSPVLDQTPLTATARAMAPTKVVSIDAGQILALCLHDPKFGYSFMRRVARALAQRLNATRLQLLDVYRHELPAIDI